MVSSIGRVLVCEKTGCWAVALRMALAGETPQVYEVRSLQQCWRELSQSPTSFVAVEATGSNIDRIPRWLLDVSRRFPSAVTIVLASRDLENYRYFFREAGAVFVLFSPRQVGLAARMASRHIATASTPPLTFRQKIWRRLPWG